MPAKEETVPRFRPAAAERLALRLIGGDESGCLEGLVSRWVGLPLSDADSQLEFFKHVLRLSPEMDDTSALWTSCTLLFGEEAQDSPLRFWCWRVASSLNHIRRGIPLTSWKGLLIPAVVPLVISRARRGWSMGAVPKLGSTIRFRAIDGEVCPMEFERWFSDRYLFVMARELNMMRRKSSRQGSTSTLHRNELVGMRMVAWLNPRPNNVEMITFDNYSGGQFRSYNRRLDKARREECPKGYTWGCYECVRGADTCPTHRPGGLGRACRPTTLVLADCAVCGENVVHEHGRCATCGILNTLERRKPADDSPTEPGKCGEGGPSVALPGS